MSTNNTTLRFVQLILLACLLSSCDGGLFGTGDGQTIVDEVANSDNSAGNDVVATPSVDGEPAVTPQPFENLQIATTITAPLINIINASDQAILARLDNNNTLFTDSIAPATFSQVAELQLGENALALFDPNTSEELLRIRPLTVGASTLTTLIVRNTATQDLNVVLLSSMSISLTPTVAQLRIVQANLLSNEDTAATFSLQPGGDAPGSAEVSFSDISVESASSANYQSIGPGGYVLTDSLGRIEMESLNLQAGKIYTLIILGNTVTDQNTAILLHEDDLLAR